MLVVYSKTTSEFIQRHLCLDSLLTIHSQEILPQLTSNTHMRYRRSENLRDALVFMLLKGAKERIFEIGLIPVPKQDPSKSRSPQKVATPRDEEQFGYSTISGISGRSKSATAPTVDMKSSKSATIANQYCLTDVSILIFQSGHRDLSLGPQHLVHPGLRALARSSSLRTGVKMVR